MYISIWCTHLTLLFDTVSTIVEALVIALHQFLCPFVVEWCRLRCNASGNGFFDHRQNYVIGDREIWGKCRESGVMVNYLFSLIFSSTASTKSSFTTDGRPLRGSSCIFSRPSLNSRTHLRTIELLMACSPHTSKIWRWISASAMFFAFKKRITCRISYARGILYFL